MRISSGRKIISIEAASIGCLNFMCPHRSTIGSIAKGETINAMGGSPDGIYCYSLNLAARP